MLRCMLQFFPAPCSSPLTGLCYFYSQATANRMLVNDIPVFQCEFLPVLKFKWRFLALLLGVPLAVVIMYALCYINKWRKKGITFLTNPEKVTCTLAEPHLVNQPVILTADTTSAGQGKLTAICSGRKTGSVPVTTGSKSDIYTVSFIPLEQDSYTLAVFFNDKPVLNSPFNVTVLRKQDKQFDASKCVILDLPLGCYIPVVNSDIHFSVDTSQAGEAELIVIANGPSGDVLTQFVVIKEAQEKGNFKIKYTPSVPGEHTLHLKYGEDEIPSTPLRFIVVNEFKAPPAIASACYVLPEDLPLSDNPCKFRISTAGAGHGILTVATRGPGRAAAKINDNENGIHSCELMMSVTGIYSIDIMWNGEQIPDSPYQLCFKQIPTIIPRTCSPEKIVCSFVQSSVVNQPVILTADATKAGSGELTASCFGKENGSVPVCIDKSTRKSDIYSIAFTPQQQDDYFISVYFNGQPVPKSPFMVTILCPDLSFPAKPEKKYDASKCVITELPTGCYLPVVNSDINFSVDATQAGLAELVITTDNQSGETPSHSIISEDILKKGYFHIKYIPKVPGEHKLYLTYGGDTIPNSPLLFIVASASLVNMKPPASECYIIPSDLPLIGTSCKFHISTSGAGHGALDITTSGPGKAEVKIFDEGKGIYSCELATIVPGTYSVDITWDGQQIQGSPYQLVTGEFAAGLITGFDLESKHFQIGKLYRFKVQCQNLTQDEIFSVEAKPPSAAKVSVFSAGNSTYHVEIIPEEEGHREIWVQYGDSHVAGSPFNVTFYQSFKSHVVKSGVEKKENGKDVAFFVVSTKGDKQDNLTATVKNCSDSYTPQVEIESMDEALTRVSFPITRNTQYLLSIKRDDEHIEKSPFKLWFDPVANPNACRAYGKGLKISLAGKMASFTVNSSGAGSGEPTVTVTDQNSAVIASSLLKSGRNRYECSYTPIKPGSYSIAIEWAGLPIPCSPFPMICYTPPPYPSPFSITEQPQSSVAGEDIIFTMASSKEVKEHNNFIVFAESSTGIVDGKVTCGVFGAYCCTVKPVLAGIYTVRVCWNGVDIEGSPFTVKIGLPPRPNLVKAYGPGLKSGFVGQEGNFTLETGEAGSGTLDVKVHGPKGAFKIKMRHHPDNNRTILIRYDPKYAGEYDIDITWAGEHIPNSPFKINIQRQI